MANQYMTNVSNLSNNKDRVVQLSLKKIGGSTKELGDRRIGRAVNDYGDGTGHYGQGSENYVSVSLDAPISLEKQEEAKYNIDDNGDYNSCNRKNLPI